MNSANIPHLAEDWIALSLRWLALLGLTWSVAMADGLTQPVSIVLGFAALWFVILTALATLEQRLPLHGALSIFTDLVVSGLLFYFSGTIGGGAEWSGVLVIISGAIFYRFRGVLLTTLLALLNQAFLTFLFHDSLVVLVFLATLLPVYLGFGLSLAWIYGRMQALQQRIEKSRLEALRNQERSTAKRRRAIYDMIAALSATLNYQRILETALDLSPGALDTDPHQDNNLVSCALLYQTDESGATRLRVGAARGFTTADMRTALPGREGLIGKAIDDGEVHLSSNPDADAELSRVVALRSSKVVCCVPLRAGLETYGVLLYAHQDQDFFTPERREVLEIIANQARIAIQNARLYRDLELEKERMMEIQEDARKKLARDLHDGPTQSVAAIAMRVNFARRLLDKDIKATTEELVKVEDLARRTTKEIRHMLFTLRPLVLESQGLVPALESMAEKMGETYDQNVIISAEPEIIDEIEFSKQGVIFYIAEEAVNNARKHAQAAHIWVRLKSAGEELALLEVEDDGVGFNVSQVDGGYENRGSLGMVNMRERAELVNGYLRVESAEDQGTRISLVIPLSDEAADRVRRGL
jgi:signal transduction histidine kinase